MSEKEDSLDPVVDYLLDRLEKHDLNDRDYRNIAELLELNGWRYAKETTNE